VLSKFWEAAGGKLADRWAVVSAQALAFWLAGLAAWLRHHGGVRALAAPSDWLERQSGVVQALTVLVLLLSVAASGVAVNSATGPTLRLLEGYWPRWAGGLRRNLVDAHLRRAERDKLSWQQAHTQVQADDFTADDLTAYAVLERRRRRRPSTPAYFMPTAIGNIIRAAERRPADRYGLDTIVVWPHLWLLLPEHTRTDLQTARRSLDSAVRTAIWGGAFCLCTVLTWLALPVGLAVVLIATTVVVPARAQVFCDLFEAAFDLHRTALYQQLRWPLPTDPQAEVPAGRQLTAYLWRGSDRPVPGFTLPTS
jgi:hypothetical protein